MTDDQMQALARLRSMIETKRVQMLANPERYFDLYSAKIGECIACFDELERALSPEPIFNAAHEMGVEPSRFVGGEIIQVKEAKRVLQKFRDGGFK